MSNPFTVEYSAEIVSGGLVLFHVRILSDGEEFSHHGSRSLDEIQRLGFAVALECIREVRERAFLKWAAVHAPSFVRTPEEPPTVDDPHLRERMRTISHGAARVVVGEVEYGLK